MHPDGLICDDGGGVKHGEVTGGRSSRSIGVEEELRQLPDLDGCHAGDVEGAYGSVLLICDRVILTWRSEQRWRFVSDHARFAGGVTVCMGCNLSRTRYPAPENYDELPAHTRAEKWDDENNSRLELDQVAPVVYARKQLILGWYF